MNDNLTLQPTLPQTAYVAEEHYRIEAERIFHREWFYAGREEAVPEAGDYLHVDVAGESILITRTRDGALAAYYNMCRHRGSQLVNQNEVVPGSESHDGALASGRFKGVITCGYHAWCYELSGQLRSAPFLGDAEGFRKEDFSLYRVGVETWGGFLFVNLSPEEAAGRGYSLAAQLGDIPQRLVRYPLSDLRVGRRITYEVAANWKVIVENYNECYHCGPVHPELCRVVPDFKKQGGGGLDWEDGIPHAEGMVTFTATGTTTRTAFPGLSEAEQTRHKGELIYPNMLVSLSMDHVAAFQLLPQGPHHTRVICDFLFHPAEIAKPDFDSSDAADFWDMINKQDWAVCESVQRGMASRRFEHGYYAPMEDLSADIRRYLADKLGDG